MKLEGKLLRVVIVHLHTESCHTNKGSFQMQLDYAGAACIEVCYIQSFQNRHYIGQFPLGHFK